MKIGDIVNFSNHTWAVKNVFDDRVTLRRGMLSGLEVLNLVRSYNEPVSFYPSIDETEIIADYVPRSLLIRDFSEIVDRCRTDLNEIISILKDCSFREEVAEILARLTYLHHDELKNLVDVLKLWAVEPRKIECIKALRSLSGMSLIDAKHMMEAFTKI